MRAQQMKKRVVEPVKGYENQVLARLSSESPICLDGVDFLIDGLESWMDPDRDELCGHLGGEYEVYAMRIPGCAERVLAVAIKRGQGSSSVTLFGTLPSARDACLSARTLAQEHLRLRTPTWEAK